MAMSKFQKFLTSIGINSAAAAGVGAKLVGPLSYFNGENLGGYLNPNVIDGYSYNPSDGKWYKPSAFDGSFDFSNPAPSDVASRLNSEQYWRGVHNKVENVGPNNPEAGSYDSPSIFDIYDKLPEIVDRYKEIAPDLWEQFKDYVKKENWGRIFTPVGGSEPGEQVPICYRNAKGWRQPIDPLMLDLDGDGLELRRADGQVLFDHNGDTIKTGTGWISGDDGILVRDINGDGQITSGMELFGQDTVKLNGQKAANGFDALADLDSNHDGNFTSADLAWSSVKVWRDLDQDGVSDAGELFTLDQLGISRIGVLGRPS